MSNSNLTKLSCKVVSFSSEDEDYPATQLNTISPNTRGWQSCRFPSYPQELGFQLVDGEAPIAQLQLLSHQSKIATKIEMFIGRGATYKTATFVRLGYMSLDSNERSSFQARELKTIYIDNLPGSFIKLIIFENHINKLNIYNQVGIIAVSLLGPSDDSLAPPKGAGGYQGAGAKRGPPTNYNDLSIDLNLDPQTAGKLRQLADAKARAVEAEDYLTAKQIKVVEHELKALGSKLAQLDMAKADAVAAEDYDLAKEIKDETDHLRGEIEQKIMNIHIPGVALAKPAPKVNPKPKFAPEGDERNAPLSSRRVPDATAFDEMPISGTGAAGHAYMSPESIKYPSGKKVAKVEPLHYEDNISHRHGQGHDSARGHYDDDQGGEQDPYGDAKFESEEEGDGGHLPYTERAIKPKANVDYNAIGGIDDDPNAFRTGGGPAKPQETFPEGQHPLEMVPGFLDLPAPEALSKAGRETAEQHNILNLLGEYRVRCLFSKTWVLREAAVKKTMLMLASELMRSPGLGASLPAVAGVIRVAVEDKIQQVAFAGVALIDELLLRLKGSEVPRSAVVPLFDATIAQLVEKLADGNGRLREAGRRGLELLAASSHLGPGAVASHCARALPPKQKTLWRPIAARIQMLTDLVNTYGLGGSTGMTVDMVLGFSKTHQAYAHSSAEVREDAKKLVVAVHRVAGAPAVESTLKLLRAKQLEEYEAAFEAASGDKPAPMAGPSAAAGGKGSFRDGSSSAGGAKGSGSGSGAKGSGGGGASGAQPPASPARVDKHLQHATHTPGGKVPTSASKAAGAKDADHHGGGGNGAARGDEQPDFTTCMFCQLHDPAWTENDLDVHYWKDCPLLISCPSCAQIVEIAGLPEHLLDECDEKDSYVPCEVTGLAIRANEFDAWKRGPSCRPAPANCLYCPLCLASVEDSDSAWLAHLKRGCPRNTRTNGS